MTYFYPFGYINPSASSATRTVFATTASLTASANSIPDTTFHALSVRTPGASGSTGPAATADTCTAITAPQGPSGSIGPSGSRGPNLAGCPSGTVVCSNLTPPSGYAFVCIQTGSCGGIIVCPDVLP